MVGFYGLMFLLQAKEDSQTKHFAIYEPDGIYSQRLHDTLASKYTLENGKPNFALEILPISYTKQDAIDSTKNRIFDGKLTGLFILSENFDETREFEYRSENVGNFRDIGQIVDELQQFITESSAKKRNIAMQDYLAITREIDTKSVKITPDGQEEETNPGLTFGVAYGSAFLLFFLVVFTGQLLVRSLLEEKSNRIMEVLVSSCSSFELMMGKLVGLSGLGITQALVWGIFGIIGIIYSGTSISLFAGVPILLVFLLLGYVLYAAILLGIGSLTTTEQEAQQITSYVTMMLVLPIVAIFPILQEPNSTLATVLSFIPFISPTIMAMRTAILMPPVWEIATSISILLVSIMGIVWVSSKIFRVAILSYGKRATLPEILSYLKEK
jgi:ABC-2 type transport system permease protein